jgi:hypothetical protein
MRRASTQAWLFRCHLNVLIKCCGPGGLCCCPLQSQHHWLLTVAAEGVVRLLYPLKFQHVNIPVMPWSLTDYLEVSSCCGLLFAGPACCCPGGDAAASSCCVLLLVCRHPDHTYCVTAACGDVHWRHHNARASVAPCSPAAFRPPRPSSWGCTVMHLWTHGCWTHWWLLTWTGAPCSWAGMMAS